MPASTITITPRSLRDISRLPPNPRAKVSKQLYLLTQDPNHKSLGTRRIKGCRQSIFELRIDQQYRMAVEPVPGGYLVLAADDHDDLYRRVHRVSTLQAASSDSVDEPIPQIDETPDQDYAPDDPLPLFRQDQTEALLDDGVTSEGLQAVLSCMSEDELLGLDLPTSLHDFLLDAYTTGGEPCVRLAPTSAEDLDEVLAADPLSFPWDLPPRHSSLVQRRLDGPLLIKGSAGSGKTAIAVHRAIREAQQPGLFDRPGPAVLFVCYNRALAALVKRALKSRLGDIAHRVEVCTIDKWCVDYLEQKDECPSMLFGDEVGVLRDAIRSVRRELGDDHQGVLDLPEDLLREEVTQVIEGRLALHRDAYLNLKRIGRRRPFSQSQREVVWKIYEEYRGLQSLYDATDWDGLIRETWEALEKDPSPPRYRTVIVDETQDMSPARLRICRELAEDERVMFLADGGQNIYRPGFQWRDLGLNMSGRTETLTRNLRQTTPIHRFVRGISGDTTPAVPDDDEDDALAEVAHRSGYRTGPMPTVVTCLSFEAELDYVVEQIQEELAKSKRIPAEIAVLAFKNRLVSAIARRLESAGVSAITSRNPSDPALFDPDTVKVLTCHSAKGLEFSLVFVVDVNDGVFPRDAAGATDELATVMERSRRVLFVACSRASEELRVTCTKGNESPFLGSLDAGLFRRMIYPLG